MDVMTGSSSPCAVVVSALRHPSPSAGVPCHSRDVELVVAAAGADAGSNAAAAATVAAAALLDKTGKAKFPPMSKVPFCSVLSKLSNSPHGSTR